MKFIAIPERKLSLLATILEDFHARACENDEAFAEAFGCKNPAELQREVEGLQKIFSDKGKEGAQ